MPDLSSEDLQDRDQDSGHSHHRRKKKRRHRKLLRKIIIGALFVLACVVAMVTWYLLVQDPAPRTSGVWFPLGSSTKA